VSDLPLRRVLIVLVVYGLAAWLLLPALDAVQRLLLLPPMFGGLARIGLVAGVPVAAVVAWRYPQMGGSSVGGAAEGREVGGSDDPGT